MHKVMHQIQFNSVQYFNSITIHQKYINQNITKHTVQQKILILMLFLNVSGVGVEPVDEAQVDEAPIGLYTKLRKTETFEMNVMQ